MVKVIRPSKEFNELLDLMKKKMMEEDANNLRFQRRVSNADATRFLTFKYFDNEIKKNKKRK